MKPLGVVLMVLGVIAVLVGVFPKEIGQVPSPRPGFHAQQTIAVVVGGVVFILGIIFCATGKKKPAAEEAAPAPEPAAEKPAEPEAGEAPEKTE